MVNGIACYARIWSLRAGGRNGLHRELTAAALVGSMLALSGCSTWQCCSEAPHSGEFAMSVGEQRSVGLSNDVDDVIEWRHRRLRFRSSTLAEIVEEMGRYNPALRLRVEGDELRGKRYAGVLDADDPQSLIIYLMSDTSVVLERERHGWFVVRANSAAVLPESTL